ncbi:MAG: hypothetical protein MJ014_03375 [Methanocorpusculum sp.]|nr:hypothetical protein [Methanocorpusculum sp.]
MNDLPADFDTFSEQHRKNFLRVRALSRENHIVGTFCTFVPRELIRAAGARCPSHSTAERTPPFPQQKLTFRSISRW